MSELRAPGDKDGPIAGVDAVACKSGSVSARSQWPVITGLT